jgi:hypothetical protein
LSVLSQNFQNCKFIFESLLEALEEEESFAIFQVLATIFELGGGNRVQN